MTLRRMDAPATGETRRQEARIAALFARPTTKYRPGRCVQVAKASLFSSLLVRLRA